MTDEPQHRTEIIRSEKVLRPGTVTDVEAIRTRWSIFIAICSLLIATAVLVVAVYANRSDLVTWATGLISAIAGSAITYGFNSKSQV